MFILVAFAILAVSQSVSGLNCFNCINVEIDPSSSSFYQIFTGKSDPNCGVLPISSNTVTCPEDGQSYKCGAFNGEATVSLPIFGDLKAKTRIMSCVIDNSNGGCSSDAGKTNQLINVLLKIIDKFGLGVTVKGEVCTCDWDMCVLCDGGVSIAGYCMKYWQLGLAAAGFILASLLCVTCCCCCGCCGCCGCCSCRTRQQGVVLQTNIPYRTLNTVGPNDVVYTTGAGGGVSVQSGDIIGYSQPVAYVDQQYA